MTHPLLTGAQALSDRLLEVTRRLVAIPSETPPSDTGAAVEEAIALAIEMGASSALRHEREAPVRNAVLRWCGGEGPPALILSCHIDTYPVGDRAAWTKDPFGEQDGTRFYGRGSADMKGGIAACFGAMALLAERAPDIAARVAVVLAGDEEAMGERGTGMMIADFPEWRGASVIVPDVGAPRLPRIGEKGMLWLRIEAEGLSAHSAHKHRGRSAIAELTGFLDRLMQLEALETPAHHPARAVIAAANPLSESLSGAGESEALSRVTVNVGTIRGGSSPNLVPAEAEAEVDIRLPQGVGCAEVLDRIEGMLAAHAGRVRLEILRRYEPNATDASAPIVRACLDAAETILGLPAAANLRIGASDARLWRRGGFDTVVCGLTPGNLGGADEYLLVPELAELAALLARAAETFLADLPPADLSTETKYA
ncbi:MAG: family metallopeptidase [Cereibacter sp.]|jgi:succinyl-diaminopimelate desuccinylase|nr:family metallopeptidase [Cereibacter sp.]